MRKLLGALCASASLCITAAQAEPAATPDDTGYQQSAVETVYVTARRRSEDVQSVPLNVTPISGDELRIEDIGNALDLQNIAPTLTVSGNLGSRDDNVFTIRGQTQPFGGADPGVQTYFAEVPFNASGPGTYYDMDNIQVLTGPQGTLFGRNTTGGAILFQPRKPEDQFGGYLDAQIGDYAMRELQGALNVPVIGDKLLVRVAGDVARRNGFTRNTIFGTDLDNVDYDAFRVSATMRPFEGFENYVVFDYLRDRNHGTGAELTAIAPEAQFIALAEGYGLDPSTAAAVVGAFYPTLQYAVSSQQAAGVRKTTSSIPLFFKRDSWGVTDIASYDIDAHLRIRNIFGYRSDKEQPAFDYDGSFLPILDISNPRTWESDSRQVTNEFQLQGESGDNSVRWIAGYYYEHDYPGGYSEVQRDTFGGALGGSPLGSTEIDSLSNGGTSSAVFGQASWNVTEKLTLTGGARYTWDRKVADTRICFLPSIYYASCPFPIPNTPEFGAAHQTASFQAPTWTLAANYQLTGDSMIYATFRRGYKSGGFNSGAPVAVQEFKPEYLTDVEIGSKNNWTIFGVPGRTDLDAYYGWYRDVQKNDLIAVIPPAGPPEPVALTLNAAKATIKGIDFQTTIVPAESVELSFFWSYTDASYDSFVIPSAIALDNMGGATFLYPADHAGDPFAYTPQDKFGLTGRFHIPVDPSLGDPVLSATWYDQSKVWFSDFSDIEPDAFQKSYDLINARLDWNNIFGSSFDAAVFVNNLTDQTYKVGANALLHLTGTSASIYGPPRMWGVELRARFGADAE
jgi:iron complex outermembrane recepter protein